MKKMRYTALSILALSAFLLTACGNKSEEAVSSSPPSSSQVASTSSSSSTISSKPSASKQVTGSSQSRVASAVSSSQDTVASSEASSAAETSSSSVAVTEASPAPVAQGAVARDQPDPAPEALVADANQSAPDVSQPAEMANPQPVSPGAAAGQWGGMTINGDGTVVMADTPYVITSITPGESGILYMNAMQDHPMGTGLYYHYYPAGVAIPFENFEDPTDISRDRLIVGTGDYIDYPAELQDQMMTWLDVIYR